MSEKSAAPFPIHPFRQHNGTSIPQSYIPRWLAEIVHVRLVNMTGTRVTLDQIAEQGGFGPMVMLDLLAGGDGKEPYDAFRRMIMVKSRSIKSNLAIVVPGTPEYNDALKEFASEAKEREKAPTQVFYQSGGGLRNKSG